VKQSSKSPSINTMSKVAGPKPAQVIEAIRRKVLKTAGVAPAVYAANGYFYVTLPGRKERILRRTQLNTFYKELTENGRK
jgi:hypothetical protein